MNGFKKMLFGEKMPDKNDPKYAERYKKEVALGQAFARKLKLDVMGAYLQRWSERNVRTFIFLLFSFVIFGFITVFMRLFNLMTNVPDSSGAVQHQEYVLKEKREKSNIVINEQNNKETDEDTPKN